MNMTATELVAEARRTIRELAPSDLDQCCVLIDVREPDEYEAGRIPSAINLPRGVLEFQIDDHPALADSTAPALAHRQRPIVVYCRTGGRAALAAQALQRLGFHDVRSIAGGIVAWADAGLPVVAP
jgi:rhodanese-related sulfurtransferase